MNITPEEQSFFEDLLALLKQHRACLMADNYGTNGARFKLVIGDSRFRVAAIIGGAADLEREAERFSIEVKGADHE